MFTKITDMRADNNNDMYINMFRLDLLSLLRQPGRVI